MNKLLRVLADSSARAGYVAAVACGLLLAACGDSGVLLPVGSLTPVVDGSPALSVPTSKLAASLQCSSNLLSASRAAILLVPGTTVTPEENFSWNYIPQFERLGWPYCALTLPNNAMSDIQESAEYVVYAIREMNRLTGRKVQVVGHSQGGHAPRWALRWWPDTRAMVDDLISFAAPNHGSVPVEALCVGSGCAPAIWQQRESAAYYRALNCDAETFADISYTNIYTRFDEFVQPNLDNSGSSSLQGAAGSVLNIATQDICANNTVDHLGIGTFDPVAYALAFDALTHPGSADPRRINSSICTQQTMPGVNPNTFATDYANAARVVSTQLATYPHSAGEPALKAYVPTRCR